MLTVKTPEEVLSLLETAFPPSPRPEEVPLAEARGRVLFAPVERMPTAGFPHTVTRDTPRAARAPMSWTVSCRPAGSTLWPGRTSSPLKMRLAPGAALLQTPMVPPP